MDLETMICETGEGIGRITLNRPERGNGLTPQLIRELAETVEHLDLDPEVRVIVLAGNGTGFCGGYDLVASAEKMLEGEFGSEDAPEGSPIDARVQAENHDPSKTWDPMVDYAGMSRNVQGLHVALPLHQAGHLQGPRVLRGRRHRPGALQRPARDRR